MSEKKFYVYVHSYASGPKKGQVFYVGKGSGDRAFITKRRNPHWTRIFSKYGRNVDVVKSFSFYLCARVFEKILISYYGFDNLANYTNGGEGWHGKIVSTETKEKISKSLLGHKYGMTGVRHSDKTIEKMRKSALLQSRKGKPNKDKVVRVFKHKSGKLFFGFTSELASVSDGNPSHFYCIVNGKRKTCKGWSYICTMEEYLNDASTNSSS